MRPNIVYLHSHDTGRLLQPYGYPVSTPHLQRLAENGVAFRNAHAAAPTCSPSRAALLTGRSPHSCGMLGLAHRGFGLSEPGHHLVHTLRPAGYHCVLAGLQHVARQDDTERIGYDEVLRPASAAQDNAAAFLRDAAGREPFFLDAGFFETHRLAGEGGLFTGGRALGDPRYVSPPKQLPDVAEVRADIADFAVAVERLDAKVGVVLDTVEAAGLAARTVVVYTTDHGPAFPMLKCNATAGGTGVALIMRGPGGLGGGRIVDGLVSHLDIFPTLCELADIRPPDWLQGRSIMPLVGGRRAQVNDEIFAEVTFHAAYEPQRAVRTPRYAYVRNFGPRRAPVLSNCDDGATKTFLLEHGWGQRVNTAEELYDTVLDPVEVVNLAGDPRYATVLHDMRDRLSGWMRRTDDPLLSEDPVRAPAGAVVDDGV